MIGITAAARGCAWHEKSQDDGNDDASHDDSIGAGADSPQHRQCDAPIETGDRHCRCKKQSGGNQRECGIAETAHCHGVAKAVSEYVVRAKRVLFKATKIGNYCIGITTTKAISFLFLITYCGSVEQSSI
jgi:hypothetical protein